MTCRAPSSGTTCAGTQSGAQLGFDHEGRMTQWQNLPSNPSSTASELYDGEGNRVLEQTQQIGTPDTTTQTTIYVSNIGEVSSTGCTGAMCPLNNPPPVTTTYYYANGQRIAMAVNGTFYYLGTDNLGSTELVLTAAGTEQASQLYGPYGGTGRYHSGTMPTQRLFTGQVKDATLGIMYYGARYYDQLAGVFISGDSVAEGLNRYAYTGDNPTSRIDPTGHFFGCIGVGSQQTLLGQMASVVGCGLDAIGGSTQSSALVAYGYAAVKAATASRNSGAYEWLNSRGTAAMQEAISPANMAPEMAKNFNPKNIMPGSGESAADYALAKVRGILTDARNLRDDVGDPPPWGTNASRALGTFLEETLPKWSGALETIGKVGKVLGWAGVAVTGVTAGVEDYSEHGNVSRAVGVGALHAGLSMAGAWIGGAAGTFIGGLFGPGAIVMSPLLGFLGVSAGAYGGDLLATGIMNYADSGALQSDYNTLSSDVSSAWDSVSSAWNGFTSWSWI